MVLFLFSEIQLLRRKNCQKEVPKPCKTRVLSKTEVQESAWKQYAIVYGKYVSIFHSENASVYQTYLALDYSNALQWKKRARKQEIILQGIKLLC